MHLTGGLGAGRHLKFDLHAINGVGFARGADVERGDDQAGLPSGGGLPQACPDCSLRAPLKRGPIHIASTSAHGGASEHVLGHGFFNEALGSNNLNAPRVDVILRSDTEDAPKVVDMAVRIDHRTDLTVSAVLAIEREGSSSRFSRDQRVNDDDARVAFNESHIRQVKPTDLINALNDFVEALPGNELGLPPKAGVNGVRGISVKEGIGVVVPHDLPVGVMDNAWLKCCDEPRSASSKSWVLSKGKESRRALLLSTIGWVAFLWLLTRTPFWALAVGEYCSVQPYAPWKREGMSGLLAPVNEYLCAPTESFGALI